MNSIPTSNKKRYPLREARWDNARCFLICSVVIGHMLYHFLDKSDLARSLYLFIYSYHMPAFVFLSGLFSVNVIRRKQYDKVLFYICIYLLMNVTEALAASVGTGKMQFHLFWESGPAWYALAMAVWYLISFLLERIFPDYSKGRWFVITLCIAIAAGYDNHLGDHFASARILTFYPFFVLGTALKRDVISRYVQKMVARISAWLVMLAVLCCSLFLSEYASALLKILKGKYAYTQMGLDSPYAIPVRVVYYTFSILMCLVLLAMVSGRKTFFTKIGEKTLPIFVWHPAILTLLFTGFGIKSWILTVWPLHYVAAAVLLAILIVFVCALLPRKVLPESLL